MIEFYQLDDATNEYDHAGTIEDGEATEGDLDWVLDFVEGTDDLSIDDEEAVVFRVSNEYLVGVIPDDDAELAADSDRSLIDDTTPDFDAHYLRLLEGHAWHPDTDRALIAASEVPEMVTERLREAVLGSGLFAEIDSISSNRRSDLLAELSEGLTSDGWTTDDLTERVMDVQPGVTESQAETLVRTEVSGWVNTARENAYEDRGLEDDRFVWRSQDDHRRTEACAWLTETTEERDGVTLEELRELVAEAPTHDDDMDDDLARPDSWIVHPNERSTFIRKV